MSESPSVEMRYQTVRCKLIDKDVWAIVVQQPDGAWWIVNCLDKDEACYRKECAFTIDGGSWPYNVAPAVPLPAADRSSDLPPASS